MQETVSRRSPPHLSSVGKTFGNIIVSIVGAGVLGLPYAFKHTGWLLTSLVLASVAFLSYYCMLLLVRCRKRLEKDADMQIDSFSDIGFLIYGNFGRLFVDYMMVLSQGAFCIAYLIFIGENLASVVNSAWIRPSEHESELPADLVVAARRSLAENRGEFLSSKEGYIWIIFPFEVVLASIRSLTNLAPFSIFADMANAIAMTVVMHQDTRKFTENGIASVVASRGIGTIPFAVGVSIYAFEGFGLVLPLESAMKERKKFGRVLAVAMACITILYIVFGLLGYLAFGEETSDIITLNLGMSRRTVMVKLSLCMGLFFSFPVMMYPVYEVLERRLVRGKTSMVLRGMVVLGAAWCAAAVPQFGIFLSLMGNSVCCMLAFILPALFHIKSHRSELPVSALLIDSFIISFGVIYGLWGTLCALQDVLAA